jgi:hypothetical protein
MDICIARRFVRSKKGHHLNLNMRKCVGSMVAIWMHISYHHHDSTIEVIAADTTLIYG